jgi:EAL domain-containing protein (putative c-di-GMP-specific phosphodiesterase class I)/GGDEF domain-containing protein
MGNSEPDHDGHAAKLRVAIAACLANGNAILLLPPATDLPLGWAAPWWQAGWKTADCAGLDGLSPAPGQRQEQRFLVVANELLASDDAASSDPAPVTESPLAGRRHGRLRRSDFLAELALELQAPVSEWPILMAVRVDQAANLVSRLGQAAAFDLEQRIAQRFASVLEPEDAYTLWLEFGFGVLVNREKREQIVALAERICASVSASPFDVAGEPCPLTVSIGLALPPAGAKSDGPDRWFASAHAAQAIAQRHGGNGHDGILSHEYDGIPAERVLIIREWAREAASGENIQVEFQPMQPLKADSAGLYMVHAKLRDYRAPLGGVYRDEYLHLARDAGSMTMIDRVSLFECLSALGQLRERTPGACMLVPTEVETLDGSPWRWLEAELHRHPQLADGLIVQLDADPSLVEPEQSALLARLRAAGALVALSDRSGGLAWVAVWAQVPADFLRLPYPVVASVTDQAFLDRMAPWREHGRKLIVDGVEDFPALPRLTRLGIDYLQGRAVAGSSPRPDFEFARPDKSLEGPTGSEGI